MAAAICSACIWEIQNGQTIDTRKSKTAWAEEVGVSEASIRRHLQHGPEARAKALEVVASIEGTGPKMRILAFDLENSPNLADVWGLWDQNIGLKQLRESTYVMCFGARWYGEDEVIFRSRFHDGKEAMLEEAWELIDSADAFLGWNTKGFDYKHINREFFTANMVPPSEPKHIDLMLTARQRFKFPSNKLDYVAGALGVGQKVQHSGHELWQRCMANDPEAWEEMKEYQIQDVNLLIDLYERFMPWIRNHPNAALHLGKALGCVQCGSANLSHMSKPSFTGVSAFAQYRCDDCGRVQRDSARLSTTALRPA